MINKLIGVPDRKIISSLRRRANFFGQGIIELCEREMELCTHIFFSPPWNVEELLPIDSASGTAGRSLLDLFCSLSRGSALTGSRELRDRSENERKNAGEVLVPVSPSFVFPLFFFLTRVRLRSLQRTVGDRDEGWVVCRDGIAGAPLIYPFTHPCWRPGSCKGAPILLADQATGRGPSFTLLFTLLGLSTYLISLLVLHPLSFSSSYTASRISASLSLSFSLARFCLFLTCSPISSLLSVPDHDYARHFMLGSSRWSSPTDS